MRRPIRHGVHGGVEGIHPGLNGRKHSRCRDARRIVGVDVNRHPDLLPYSSNEDSCSGGLQEASHVLEAQDVTACAFARPT